MCKGKLESAGEYLLVEVNRNESALRVIVILVLRLSPLSLRSSDLISKILLKYPTGSTCGITYARSDSQARRIHASVNRSLYGPANFAYRTSRASRRTLLLLPTLFIRHAAVLLGLRVLLRAHHFDSNEALVPLDPGVVSGRDSVRFTRDNGFLRSILHTHGQAPRNGVSDMGNLA